jgi:hypothetical protein
MFDARVGGSWHAHNSGVLALHHRRGTPATSPPPLFEQTTLKSQDALAMCRLAPHSRNGRRVMNNYEIRIVKRSHEFAVHRSEHISDHAAIRRGHALAEDGDQVEIWRGTQCVYAGQHVPLAAH